MRDEATADSPNMESTQKSPNMPSGTDIEPKRRGRVLVVDDVESNLYMAEGCLMSYEVEVDFADSGTLAVSKIKDGEIYDIILMDHMMPNMDGIEATKTIRGMGYNHPIVALTANTFSDCAQMFRDSGFTGYTSKPIDSNQLYNYLKRFIKDKKSQSIIQDKKKAKSSDIDIEAGYGLPIILSDSFLRDAKRVLGILEVIIKENTFDADALKSYIIQAHSIKSALFNIKMRNLSDAADTLEEAGRAADLAFIKSNTPSFLNDLRDIINRLELDKELRITDQGEDLVFLRDQLLLIQKACEAFDIDAANSILKKLGQIAVSKKTVLLLEEIADHILSGDFEEAEARSKQAANELELKR